MDLWLSPTPGFLQFLVLPLVVYAYSLLPPFRVEFHGALEKVVDAGASESHEGWNIKNCRKLLPPHSPSSASHKGQIPDLLVSFSIDVPSWLKSLRLHKYAALFSQMSYEEMMTLTEQHLESQVKPVRPWGGDGAAPF